MPIQILTAPAAPVQVNRTPVVPLFAQLFDRAEAISDRARRRFPSAGITLDVINAYPGLATDKRDGALRKAMAAAGGDHTIKVAFGTEGGLFTQALSAPVIVCGPGSMDQGHKADEFVERSQIEACRAMLARLSGESLTA